MYKFIKLEEADDKKHKYIVTLKNQKTDRLNNIKFGAYGMDDFTITKNEEQKMRYIERHRKRENWNDPSTAGFWSYWILWNKPTLQASLKETLKKYNL